MSGRLVIAGLACTLLACATGGPGGGDYDAGPRFAPIPDAGRPGSGDCGSAGSPCCGGFCDPGLSCNPAADRCEASTCGAEGQDCCAEGPACQGMLTCLVSGVCVQPGLVGADGGTGCGMRGGACCASDPPCGAGLACTSGTCLDAPSCGASGQACCMGSMCNTGLACEAGTCRVNVTPMCVADGGSCAVNGDCCNNSCMSGRCQAGSTGGTSTPCNTFSDCGSCTNTEHCMWCDGLCEPYFTGGKLLCAAYPFQC